MASFAEGLKGFFERGALVKRCRITNKKKLVILQMIADTSDKTCDMDDLEFEYFMKATQWLNYQLGLTKDKQVADVKTAGYIMFWLNKFYYYDFDENDYNDACDWIMNKLSKKYSISEMSMGKENI